MLPWKIESLPTSPLQCRDIYTCTAGNFRGAQFSQLGNLYYFADLISTDMYSKANALYNFFFLVGSETTEVGPVEMFSAIVVSTTMFTTIKS
jgi:hypothetical protein